MRCSVRSASRTVGPWASTSVTGAPGRTSMPSFWRVPAASELRLSPNGGAEAAPGGTIRASRGSKVEYAFGVCVVCEVGDLAGHLDDAGGAGTDDDEGE